MVLQSFAQYRSFAASRHVGDVAQRHTQTQAAESHAGSRHQPPHMSNAQSDAGKAADEGTATSTPIETRSSTHSSSPGRELPGSTVGERVEMEEREKALAVPAVDHSDPFLITWDDGEEANPQNWSWLKKWLLIAMVTSIGLLVGAASSINSAAAEDAAQFFGVGSEVMELQTAVFLIGFGLAAPLLGSLSEIGGRNPVYAITLLLFVLFEVGSGLAQNIQTRVILRFFAGFFGSTPLSNAGGSIADVVNARQRTFVFAVFANAGFLGPVLGPVMGGYIGMNVGQAWCDYLTAIWGAATLAVVVCFMPETYGPVLLRMKAAQVRKATGDDRYKSALEREREKVPFKAHFKHVIALPFLYLIYEPIVALIAAYMTVIYIILFGDFEAYSLIFTPFGLNPGELGLAFLPIAIGLFVTTAFTPLVYARYLRITKQVQEKKRLEGDKDWQKAGPAPEERLVMAMIGAFLVPIGLFYQAWTSYPTLPPWPCLSAGVLFGAGILTCFISSYQYIIDVYQAGSATALGSLTFVRYIVSGGAVLFTPPMYRTLGNQWALSLLAFLSLAFCAVPWIFFLYGHRIRRASRYAPADD